MAEYPTLFYSPTVSIIEPIVRLPWRHPATGDLMYNPQPDVARDLLPLAFYVPEPRDDIQTNTVVYARNQTGTQINMSWASELKAIGPLYVGRREDLRAYAVELARYLPGHDPNVGVQQIATHAIAIAQGDTLGAGSPYQYLRDNGEWFQKSEAEAKQLLVGYRDRQQAIGAQYEIHKDAMKALRDADDHVGLVEYDYTTGWPT